MEKVKQQFAKRLREAMVKAGYKPEAAVLERNFNLNYYGKPITLHGVRKWLIGESIPPYDKIIALATMLRITPEKLTFDLEINKKVKEERARWDEGIGYQEREVFEAYLTLPIAQRKIVREVIQTFAKAFPAEEQVASKSAKSKR